MKQKQLTNFELDSFIYFIIRSLFLGLAMNQIFSVAKQDSWISIILGTVIGTLLLLLILKISSISVLSKKKEHKKPILVETIFFIIVLIIIGIILYHFVLFLQITYLNNTPSWAISALFLIAIYYLLSKGLQVIGRVSGILWIISLLLIAISFASLIPQVRIDNIKPILANGAIPILKSALFYAFYTVIPLFLLSRIPLKTIDEEKKVKRNIIISYIGTSTILFFSAFFTITIFGIDLSLLYQYPELNLLKKVSILGVFERMEGIFGIQWMFSSFIMLVLSFYSIDKILTNHLNKEKKKILLVGIFIGFILIETIFL